MWGRTECFGAPCSHCLGGISGSNKECLGVLGQLALPLW